MRRAGGWVSAGPYAGYAGSPYQKFGHLSFGQHGEDLLIVAIFDAMGKVQPSYLDIGCWHPQALSNSALIHARGGRGVAVDANPEIAQLWADLRPEATFLGIGCGPVAERRTFYRQSEQAPINSFSAEHIEHFKEFDPRIEVTDAIDEVEIQTIDQIIDAHCGGVCPDFVSIDVESFDLAILQSFSFRTGPAVFCIETGNDEDAITALLERQGYDKIAHVVSNGIYVERKWAPLVRFGPHSARLRQPDHGGPVQAIAKALDRIAAQRPFWQALMPPSWRRRRELAALAADGVFNADAYLARYPDVAGAGVDPLDHYLRHGFGEGRVPG